MATLKTTRGLKRRPPKTINSLVSKTEDARSKKRPRLIVITDNAADTSDNTHYRPIGMGSWFPLDPYGFKLINVLYNNLPLLQTLTNEAHDFIRNQCWLVISNGDNNKDHTLNDITNIGGSGYLRAGEGDTSFNQVLNKYIIITENDNATSFNMGSHFMLYEKFREHWKNFVCDTYDWIQRFGFVPYYVYAHRYQLGERVYKLLAPVVPLLSHGRIEAKHYINGQIGLRWKWNRHGTGILSQLSAFDLDSMVPEATLMNYAREYRELAQSHLSFGGISENEGANRYRYQQNDKIIYEERDYIHWIVVYSPHCSDITNLNSLMLSTVVRKIAPKLQEYFYLRRLENQYIAWATDPRQHTIVEYDSKFVSEITRELPGGTNMGTVVRAIGGIIGNNLEDQIELMNSALPKEAVNRRLARQKKERQARDYAESHNISIDKAKQALFANAEGLYDGDDIVFQWPELEPGKQVNRGSNPHVPLLSDNVLKNINDTIVSQIFDIPSDVIVATGEQISGVTDRKQDGTGESQFMGVRNTSQNVGGMSAGQGGKRSKNGVLSYNSLRMAMIRKWKTAVLPSLNQALQHVMNNLLGRNQLINDSNLIVKASATSGPPAYSDNHEFVENIIKYARPKIELAYNIRLGLENIQYLDGIGILKEKHFVDLIANEFMINRDLLKNPDDPEKEALKLFEKQKEIELEYKKREIELSGGAGPSSSSGGAGAGAKVAVKADDEQSGPDQAVDQVAGTQWPGMPCTGPYWPPGYFPMPPGTMLPCDESDYGNECAEEENGLDNEIDHQAEPPPTPIHNGSPPACTNS